jgi:pyridoxamine 5'-phosphate oxidase family protein
MSVFTAAEIDYLRGNGLGRLATIGPDGQPHITPVTYVYNADEDTIDIGGVGFGGTKKWRDAKGNPAATFLVDDSDGKSARAVEIRGTAETHDTGGDRINPRFPNFKPEFIRLRPRRIVAWGLDPQTDDRFALNARSV